MFFVPTNALGWFTRHKWPGRSARSGLFAGLFGDAFLTGQWLFIGATETDKGFPISTVLFFDIGVYLVVLGSILTMVFAMEEEV